MFTAKVFLFVCFVGSCYCREITRDVGIYHGQEISIDKAPYMASLRRTWNMKHFCGGSIINERFILTSAYCCVGQTPASIFISVGTDQLRGNYGDLYEVEKIISHDNFTFITYDFDVCLIKLSTSLEFGTNVAPISLNDGNVELSVNTVLNSTGWGYIENYYLPSQLMQVAIPLVDQFQCQSIFDEMDITSQMICAGGGGAGICDGDNGGPLTKGNVQVGISSYIKDEAICGSYPAIFVNVSAVLCWIDKTIAENY